MLFVDSGNDCPCYAIKVMLIFKYIKNKPWLRYQNAVTFN